MKERSISSISDLVTAGWRPHWSQMLYASYKALFFFLLICFVSCQTPMNQNGAPSSSQMPMNQTGFPSRFNAPNPIFGDPSIRESMYLSDNTFLEAEKERIDPEYALFYASIDSNLSRLSSSTQNKALAAWISALTSTTKLLEVHDNAYFNQEAYRFPNNLIQFSRFKTHAEWLDNFPDCGYSVELVSDNLDHLPIPLQEVYRLGAIWLHGIPMSGYFYHPRDIKKALQEEYLGEFISDELYRDLDYPMDELMIFYTDSGCWLMYDSQENVYCGGVECGDFYRSSKKLDEVISIIFTQLLNNDPWLSIESFAPRD